MARRTYQAGYVFQRGKTKHDRWDVNATAFARYWADVPGQQKHHRLLTLGICRTRTIAERACMQQLEQLGVNSIQQFIETTSSTTFKQQGELWLKSLAHRKRVPIEQTTLNNRRYALDKWIYPRIGSKMLGEVNNHTLKELVEEMSSSLSPASIRDYSAIVKAVVASSIDERGEERYPRKWNEEYIDAPLITKQRQPSVSLEAMERIVAATKDPYRMLYVLLTGCGPLRAGEALGLAIEHISADFRTLSIVQKAKRGVIQQFLKTKAGERNIDLCVELAQMLREFVGGRKSGLLFCTASGRQKLQRNTLRDSLHPLLRKLELPKGGFNIFRRYRLTYLKTTDCPDILRRYWAGHEQQKHVDERYIKVLEDRNYRLQWAERVGLGFSLTGQRGQLLEFRKAG